MNRILAFFILAIVCERSFSQNGKLLDSAAISKMCNNGNIILGPGTYCFPVNFQYNFFDNDVTITGVPGKTIITTWDTSSATNFAPRELNTTLTDNNADGLYVVAKHPPYSYGGGFAHINLKDVSYNTGGLDVWYTQGTLLQRKAGVWARFVASAGFITKGSLIVKDVIFDNCQFYLFSPFDLAGKVYSTSARFELNGCQFNNVARVISSCSYMGINHQPNWYNALNFYSTSGQYRFKNFTIKDCIFSNIHTSIVWGFPPSEITLITGNTIRDCQNIIAPFNLFIKYNGNENYFADRAVQVITNNTFMNIKPDNATTISLIRTSGLATVSANQFINVTPQLCFLYGGNSTFSNNTGNKPATIPEGQAPIVLIKAPAGENVFTGNSIDAPQALFIALEGISSVLISGNRLNVRTVFSKNDASQGLNQYLKITGNVISSLSVSHISSKIVNSFKWVDVTGNSFSNVQYFNTGLTNIINYNISNNNFSGCVVPVITQAIYPNIENNKTIR